MPRPRVQLGPFVLSHRIGSGGMGEVWAAQHEGEGVDVAVKVITRAHARAAKYVANFRGEVRAAAGLHHPGIVMVFDFGEVDASAAAASEGRLVAGSPYYVMERASGGALSRLRRPMAWLHLKGVLIALLDALAHAHARSVVHKDLKPANILLFSGPTGGTALKLVDFGVAHAGDIERQGTVEDSLVGSPHYMAPEQFRGVWRDYGPWTDLYALGCIAQELATGTLPFVGKSVAHLAAAHLSERPPRLLDPGSALPPGFGEWVARLLEKAPHNRFRRAADAAWALVRLGDPVGDPSGASGLVEVRPARRAGLEVTESGSRTALFSPGSVADTGGEARESAPPRSTFRPVAEPTLQTARPGGADDLAEVLAGTVLIAPPLAGRASEAVFAATFGPHDATGLPPLPPTWHRVVPPPTPLRLLGVGLGLFGLRPPPLVGRYAERDAIWATLTEVRRTGSAKLVLLHGNAGVGKSRLAQWIAQRAHEVGNASVVRATHGPILGPSDGLPRLVASLVGSVGLSAENARSRAWRVAVSLGVHDTWVTDALKELVATGASGSPGTFTRPEERWGAILTLLEGLAAERPIVAWLDDVQWGDDALGFAQFVLDRQEERPLPALLLMTCRDEALAERPVAHEQLGALLERPRCARVPLPPLARAEHAQLVHQLLGLERTLAAEVEARTAGNPLFAVQLVGDWVEQGTLELGRDGFRLRDGVTATLPDDLHGVWSARIDRLCPDPAGGDALSLELAAALGQEIDTREWQQTCGIAGLEASPDLVSTLLRDRLATPSPEGWAFAHGMLRESLERRAREAGRWQQHHRMCVRMLEAEYGDGTGEIVERLGRHLLAAAEYAAALDPLIVGAAAAEASNDLNLALLLLGQHEEALHALEREASDEAWGRNMVARATVVRRLGQLNEGFDWAEECERRAQEHGWVQVRAAALEEIATGRRSRPEFAAAREALDTAREIYETVDDQRGIARVLRGASWVSVLCGELDRACDELERARRLFARCHDHGGVAGCLRGLGDVARNRDQMDEAAAYFCEGRDLYARIGNRWGVFDCVHGLAEVQRFQGDLEAAEKGYRSCLDFKRSVGSEDSSITYLNLGLVQIARARFDQARITLLGVLPTFQRREALGYLGCVHACLLPCAVAQGDTEGFDRHAKVAEELLRKSNLVDPDIAGPAQLAGTMAIEAGNAARARAALDIARWQWEALGNSQRVAEVDALVAGLEA